jgi:hypothetical protein
MQDMDNAQFPDARAKLMQVHNSFVKTVDISTGCIGKKLETMGLEVLQE